MSDGSDEIPPKLYRMFKVKEHATAFAEHGLVRLGLLASYAEIEDECRKDEAEGSCEISFPAELDVVHLSTSTPEVVGRERKLGTLHFGTSICQPFYILCCSYPPSGDRSQLPRKFGNWAVEISDPRAFLASVVHNISQMPQAIGEPTLVQVRYLNGTAFDKQPSKAEQHLMGYAYKPPGFADEFEYRLVIIESPEKESEKVSQNRVINLGGPIPKCEIFELK